MKKPWRILGTLALVAFLCWRIEWRQVAAVFGQLNAALWAAALGVYVFAQLISVVRWYMLARMLGLGGRPFQYLAYYFSAMFFNLVLPTSVGGDVVRVWYLCRDEAAEPGPGRRWAAFLSVFADRVNGLAVLITLACAAALLCPVPLPGWIVGTVATMGAATLAGLCLLPFLHHLQPLLVHPRWQRLRGLIDGAILCWRARGVLVAITLLSFAVQAANVFLAWLVGEAIGLPVPPLYYGILIPLISLLTMLPLSVNGMGLREAGTVVLLAPLGISSPAAVSLSLLLFMVYTAASLGGCVFLLFGQLPRFEASVRPGLKCVASEAPDHADPVRYHPDQGRAGQPPAAA